MDLDRPKPLIAELDEDGERIVLHNTLWSEKPLIQQIPGKKWDSKAERWTLPLSWAACTQARAIFGDKLNVGVRLGEWSRGTKTLRESALSLRESHSIEGNSPFANDHDNLLYPFQIPGRDFLVTARNALLGDEMGSGKTFQTIAAIKVVDYHERLDIKGDGSGAVELGAYPALIVCPNTLKRSWEREIRQWLPEASPIVIHGSAAKRRKQLEEAQHVDNAILIMNIESIRLHSRLAAYGSIRLKRCAECDPKLGNPDLTVAKCEVHKKELNNFEFKVCVLDEAHRVKDPNALQSRAIWSVFHAPSVRYRWALTGTPVANHPGDLWSILHTIDPESFPAKSAFIDRYALTEFNAFGGMSIVGLNPATRDEFFSIIDPQFRRMLKSVVLPQLPDKTYVRRDVEMSPKQAKAYKQIEDTFVMTTDDGTKLVMNGNLPAATRLLQLSSSMCDIDTGETPEDPATWKVTLTDPSPKVDELMAIIEDNPGKPLVIAAEHRQLIDLAANRLTAAGIEFGRITGGVSADERDATVQAFQTGKLDYVLFTYKAGGVGVTLTRADTMVRLQRSWSAVDNAQGVDRIHRIGSEQHDKIVIIDLVTVGTVEEGQIEKLYAKAERLEEIVRDREQLKKLGKSTADLDAEAARIEATDLLGHVKGFTPEEAYVNYAKFLSDMANGGN